MLGDEKQEGLQGGRKKNNAKKGTATTTSTVKKKVVKKQVRAQNYSSDGEDESKGGEELQTLVRARSHSSTGASEQDDLEARMTSSDEGGEKLKLGTSGGANEHLSSNGRTFASLFISFIGAGVLGLPFAYMKTGLMGSSLILLGVGALATYCMIILIDCKRKLEGQGKMVRGYGDVGFGVWGSRGAFLVDSSLVITQVAFCCAYLLFIGTNLHNVFPSVPKDYYVLACLPGLASLAMIRYMKHLAPFALAADVANLLGIFMVLGKDYEVNLHSSRDEDKVEWGYVFSSTPYFVGVAIYCFEGIGVIIPIERSMEHKKMFKPILVLTMILVSLVYTVFGAYGYYTFESKTREIITLNLGEGFISNFVKVALSAGLFLTFPLMLFPVFTVFEGIPWIRVRPTTFHNLLRISTVSLAVLIATTIPNFGDFISLIGAACCSLLAIILPALFHLKLCRDSMSRSQVVLDWLVVMAGVIAAILGTENAARELYNHRSNN